MDILIRSKEIIFIMLLACSCSSEKIVHENRRDVRVASEPENSTDSVRAEPIVILPPTGENENKESAPSEPQDSDSPDIASGESAQEAKEASPGNPEESGPVDQLQFRWDSYGGESPATSVRIFGREDQPYLAAPGFLLGEYQVNGGDTVQGMALMTVVISEHPELLKLMGKKVCFYMIASNSYGASVPSDQICLTAL